MDTKLRIIRQGDVLLKEIKDKFSHKPVKQSKEVTVAHGEKTGHHHTLYASLPIDFYTYDEQRFLKIQGEVTLKHQEHRALKVPAASYKIIMEREWDYFEKALRRVID